MSDERTAETPPGTPGQRALGAMESAVRRARESGSGPPLTPPHLSRAQAPTRREVAPPNETRRPPPPPRETRPPAPPGRPPAPPSRPDRWLIGTVATVAVLVVAAAIALIVSLSGNSAPTSPTAAISGPATTVPSHAPSTHPRSGATSAPTTSSPTTTTPPTVAVAPAGPPVISALSPASGSPGQSVTVSGTNFLSTTGQIVATFNGQVAPTSCPAQNTCTVTVPSSNAPSAQVVITTPGGTSNTETFTYS
jgi:hypothetical protein